MVSEVSVCVFGPLCPKFRTPSDTYLSTRESVRTNNQQDLCIPKGSALPKPFLASLGSPGSGKHAANTRQQLSSKAGSEEGQTP
jgi:hypothetical protein